METKHAAHPHATHQMDQSQKTDVLGIISIVLAVVGFQLVGLIIGIVGEQQAKKEGRPVILSRIGWIINLVICILVLFIIIAVFISIPVLQRSTSDANTKSRMQNISADLEDYYNKRSYYPPNLDAISSYPSADSESMYDDTPVSYTPSPFGCEHCESYELTAPLKSKTEPLYRIESEHHGMMNNLPTTEECQITNCL